MHGPARTHKHTRTNPGQIKQAAVFHVPGSNRRQKGCERSVLTLQEKHEPVCATHTCAHMDTHTHRQQIQTDVKLDEFNSTHKSAAQEVSQGPQQTDAAAAADSRKVDQSEEEFKLRAD